MRTAARGRDDRPQVRPTVVPPTVQRVPPIPVGVVRRATEGPRERELLWFEEPEDKIEVPEELYLREVFAVDLDDAGAIEEFARRFGMLGRRWGMAPDIELDADHSPWRDAGDGSSWATSRGIDPGLNAIPIIVYAGHLRLIRAMAEHVRVFLSGGGVNDLLDAWTAQGFDRRSGPRAAPAGEVHAWEMFGQALGAGLQPFHDRIEFTFRGGSWTVFEPKVGLYNAVCQQLRNHMAEGAVIRCCANERCPHGGRFVRQLGGGTVQYRTEGVLYCTRACAKAQAERDRRRRQRKERS